MDSGMYSWWHHCTLCSRFFCLFLLFQMSKESPLSQVRLLAMERFHGKMEIFKLPKLDTCKIIYMHFGMICC